MKKYPLPRKYFRVGRGINGLGLFTTAPIARGTFVIEYTGGLLRAKEADERGGQYLFEINRAWTIDGSSRANLARYINHSCRPNCESDTNSRTKKITITAIKNIAPGEELTYDYGKEFWKEYIEPKGCRCLKCREKKVGVKKKK